MTIRLEQGDYDTLDPATSLTISGPQIDLLTYDRLLDVSPSGQLVPYLATSWNSLPSGNGVVLHLGDKATCDDGTPVTASIVKASLEYDQNPKTADPSLAELFPTHATITADDASKTVTISLEKPFGDLLLGLAQTPASIICPDGLASASALKDKTFGSGPYQLTKSSRGNEYTFEARTGYNWGSSNGASTATVGVPSTIVAKVVENETTAANLLLSNGLKIGQVTGHDLARLNDNQSLFHTTTSQNGADVLAFNEASGLPGADQKVRTAIAMAVDNTNYNKAATFGYATVANTVYSPGMYCYNAQDSRYGVSYNPQKAQALLESDGYVKGSNGKYEKDGHQLTIRIAGITTQNSGPSYLQEALQAIGVDTKLSVTDATAYINVLFGNGAWDIADYPLGAPIPTPLNVFIQSGGPTVPNGGLNFSGINNATVNAQPALAETTSNPTYCSHWQKMEQALLSTVAFRPLYDNSQFWFGNGEKFTIFEGTLVNPLSIRGS